MDQVRSRPTIKLGLMGFGQIGRMIYQLAQHQPDIEITAIADIGEPHILCYLLQAELDDPGSFRIEGNYLVSPRYRSRMLRTDSPGEVPWDTFGVDLVIEATGQFRDRASLEAHLHAGSPRVLARTLPQNSSTESSFLASTNPALILTTASFRRGRQLSVLPRCSFRQSPKSHRSTASALLRFTRIQAINPYKITPVVTTEGAALPQKISFPIPTRRGIGCPTFSRT